MAIVFTQYLRPDGRTKLDEIERPPDIEEKARAIRQLGYVFEMELLMTGVVSFTCCKRDDQEDCIAHELCPNGPEVPGTVDKLVNGAFEECITKALLTDERN